ncbi:MAG: hypothetical protein SFU86_02215 [Pirellulaceae bacterium]|nr:hypothetical protein [Pirellulaceae bacterium]
MVRFPYRPRIEALIVLRVTGACSFDRFAGQFRGDVALFDRRLKVIVAALQAVI